MIHKKVAQVPKVVLNETDALIFWEIRYGIRVLIKADQSTILQLIQYVSRMATAPKSQVGIGAVWSDVEAINTLVQ